MRAARHNYAAWEPDDPHSLRDDASDREKLHHFARYAVLAPSGHNTQPWRFEFLRGGVALRVVAADLLDYSGPRAGEPQVSLGACLEALVLAARGHGYELQVDRVSSRTDQATVTIARQVDAEPALLDAIVQRTSNRSPFLSDPLPADLTSQLAADDVGGASVFLVGDAGDIAFTADLTAEATRSVMADPAFRQELSGWVRNNLTRRYDGMPGFCRGCR